MDLSSYPPPYCHANLLKKNLKGWYFNHKPIKALIEKYSVKTIVEVGSWMGLSTINMAKCLPEKGKVYAVDTWTGSPEHFLMFSEETLITLYDQFLSNVIYEKLTDKIVPIRMESVKAAKCVRGTPDLIYIDACHDYEYVLQDLQAWYPHVVSKGILCGDDWHMVSVRDAVETFAKKNNLSIRIPKKTFWMLENH